MRARPLSNVLIFFRCAVRVVRGFERSGSRVDHVLWVTPIKKGKTDVVRRYMDADSMEQAFKDWAASEGAFETFGKDQWADFSVEIPDPLWQGPDESRYVLECLSYYQKPGGPP